jgi:hypothetical protein
MLSTNFRKKWIVLLLGLLFLSAEVSSAQDARLTNIIVTNTRDDLLVYLNVDGAFTEKMKSAILSGVPTTFSFFIKLSEVNNFWLNKKIANLSVTHTVKYNNIKKEFAVKRSWENDKSITAQSFEEVQRLMTDLDSFRIVPLSALTKGKQYQIRAKAELNKLTLPFYLHYVLFFVSLWDFETDWYTIDFIY